MTRQRRWLAVSAAAAALLAGSYAVLALSPASDKRGGATDAAESPSASAPAFPSASPAAAVLPGLDPAAPVPTAAGVAAAISGLLSTEALGPGVTASVVDVETGETLFDRDAARPAIPASTTKVLTGAAALRALGPQHRLATTVVVGADPTSIVIVGAGDPMLTTDQVAPEAYPQRSSLAGLAAQTATALLARGVTSVSLAYDTSLFAGPGINPDWKPSYLTDGEVAPVVALSADNGRITPDQPDRVADPAATAAERFAAKLAEAGVVVTATPVPGVAAAGAEQLASVPSPTIAEMVEVMLVNSDDDVAEALLRLVGAEQSVPADVAASTAAVVDALGSAGVDVTGLVLRDGSGLARTNAIPARTLVSTLDVATEEPDMASAAADMPVAGFTGTLDDRFDNDDDRSGAGVVRAKTGSLNGVNTLAGTVVTLDGRLLAFAFMSDQGPPEAALQARADLDAAATALALCGCRS